MMQTINFGGKDMTRMGQGTWCMGDDISLRKAEIATLQKGLDLGLQLIDTAEMYGDGNAETLVGEAIKGRRDETFLVSKVLPSNASLKGTIAACERSLQRLQTDYLDMYLLHWQSSFPLEETIEAFELLKSQGKILNWGVSNFDTDEMEKLYRFNNGRHCKTDQILYNLSRRGTEFDLLPWCKQHQIPVMAYSPIEQSRLLSNEVLQDVAHAHQATSAQIALAWILENDNIIPIPKAGSVAHVEDNFESFQIRLSAADKVLLERVFPAPNSKQYLQTL